MPDPGDSRPAATRVARNTALRASAEVVGKLASVVLFAFIARRLGASTLGDFVFALAAVQIVWSVAGFGLDRMALRDIAKDHSAVDRLFADMNGIKLAVGLAGTGAVVAIVAALDYSNQVIALVVVLGLSLVAVLLSASAQTVFQAHERMEYYFYSAVPNKILAALIGIAVLVVGGGIVAVAVGQLVAAVFGLVIALFLLYRRFARPQPELRPRRWGRLAKASAPFGMQEVLGQLVFRVDTVLLSFLTTSVIVGAYGAGYRILEATLFVAWSVGTSVLPMYSYLQPGSSPSLSRVFEGSLKFVTVLMVPLSVIMFVLAEPLVDLIYGLPEYEGTVVVLRWLAFAILAYAVGHLAGILVLVRRPGRLTVIATGAVAVFNIVLNLIVIPEYGAEGAAAATLATELLLAVIALALARPVVGFPRPLAVAGGATLAGVAMAAAMLPLRDDLLLALPAGVLAYAAVLLIFEARSLTGDLAAVREVLRRSPTGQEPGPDGTVGGAEGREARLGGEVGA